jgi:hypothetical protein
MISIVNHLVLAATERQSSIWDKAAYISAYTPWIDVAIGIILCIIGPLALHGYIPIAGGSWLAAAGAAEILVGLILNCLPTCKSGYHAIIHRFFGG